VVYSALSPLPTGAFFNRQTGQFKWTPGFDQAGEHVVRFGATDPSGLSSMTCISASTIRTARRRWRLRVTRSCSASN
jgi:Putative Ig domain